jgi:uncharacterized membrane protein YsdA (DUF1294 family)
MRPNPFKFFLLAALILSICIGIAMWYYTSIHPLWSYLLTLTVTTFLFYGYDKFQAIHQNGRIPEVILHLLALAGGTAGAFAGQLVFRHKTRKSKFKAVFVAIIVLQTGLVLGWVLFGPN